MRANSSPPSSGTLRFWKMRWMIWISAKPPPIWARCATCFRRRAFFGPNPRGGVAASPKKLPEGKPCRFTAPDGTVIEVGKNSLQNDRLTLHARGGETWLHAQGIPGSHVLIRTESEPSDETLLYAAKLAAYFSKGRNHPQLPVDYTRRKYVKKSANAPAGLVTYTNFKTLIIGLTPEDVAHIIQEGGGGR